MYYQNQKGYLNKLHVINGGESIYSHPTQALGDAMTLKEKLYGDVKGKNLTIMGDIAYSRVARSAVIILSKLGMNITLCGLSESNWSREDYNWNYRVINNPYDATFNADAIMLLRPQTERHDKPVLLKLNRITLQSLCDRKHREIPVLHPGPVTTQEMAPDVAQYAENTILTQVENCLYVRMALLHLWSSYDKI